MIPKICQQKGTVAIDPFDILKRHENGSFTWLESAQDLEAAEARMRELSVESPGEYFIFDQMTQQIVAKSTRPTSN
jgi:hypothetical protein